MKLEEIKVVIETSNDALAIQRANGFLMLQLLDEMVKHREYHERAIKADAAWDDGGA